MNLSDFKIALRGMLKNKKVTSINVIGLAIGITISLFIFSYVRFEKSTDQFIPGYENIYNLNSNGTPYVSYKMVDHVRTNMPEIEALTYVTDDWSPQVFLKKDNNAFKVERMLVADSCFFKVFEFETKWGNAQSALDRADQLVLTESLSSKLFGKENPVGKSVAYNSTYLNGIEVVVGAVIKDVPKNSSWDFEAVLSLPTNFKIGWYKRNMEMWGSCNFRSFFKLNSNINQTTIIERLSNITLADVPDYEKGGLKFSGMPYSKMYFDHLELDIVKHGDKQTLFLIQAIGILILVLACINYINLITAQREKRFRNVGIIKTLGSTRKKVVSLFVSESMANLGIALLLTVVLTLIFLDACNDITQTQFSFAELFKGANLFVLLTIVGVMVVGTGVIPGIMFSKNRILELLQKQAGRSNNNWLRNSLLVFQFVVSIGLISGVLFIQVQNRHLQSVDIGFNKDNIVMATINEDIQKRIEYFQSEVGKIPEVNDLTFSEVPITNIEQNWGRLLNDNGEDKTVKYNMLHVGPHFFDFFGLKMIEGTGFTESSQKMKHHIFNQKAIKDFGVKEIAKARVKYKQSEKGQVIGVVQDFNYRSLHFPIKAAGFSCSLGNCDYAYLKMNNLNAAQFDKTMAKLKQIWGDMSPNFPMEYQFLDSSWEAHYAKDRQFQKVLNYTTLISLLISCLGLIGLSVFIMEQRTKEIGIRKVNGAKVTEVLGMLNIDLIKWIALAFVIACPLAYVLLSRWLNSFAYKANLSWWIFALGGIIALLTALITISFQSYKAATRNPVEALRYE
ncbi:ABC transporter permease [Prolixibacteraceae bacterium JC049]|nr:ABC transporter permease [Prolixibacteraceae bacterium JC049]